MMSYILHRQRQGIRCKHNVRLMSVTLNLNRCNQLAMPDTEEEEEVD